MADEHGILRAAVGGEEVQPSTVFYTALMTHPMMLAHVYLSILQKKKMPKHNYLIVVVLCVSQRTASEWVLPIV